MRILTFIIMAIFFLSCGGQSRNESRSDSTRKEKIVKETISYGKPSIIDSSDIIIIPIGSMSEDRDYMSSSFSSFLGKEIATGKIYNLIFYNKLSQSCYLLQDTVFSIQSVTILKTKDYKKLIYRIITGDIDHDSRLTSTDHCALFISNIDGSDFIQLTPNDQKLVYWEYDYYNHIFITKNLMDSDNNLKYNDQDSVIYYRIDHHKPYSRKNIITNNLWNKIHTLLP